MSQAPGTARQRSRRACLPCHRRKKKCDGNLPCSTCTGYGYDCQYNDDVRRTVPKYSAGSDASSSFHAAKPGYASSESRTSPRQRIAAASAGAIFEPTKLRYMRRHSCVAFPLVVGLELEAAHPPRLHSFAYHTGIRKEVDYVASYMLVENISWSEVKNLIDAYASTIHPVFGFLDISSLYRRSEEHWNGKPQGLRFESVISGVIALASLFSGFLNEETEARVVQHAKEILEVRRYPTIEQISASILRTIYVRATGRPHVAWLCSCVTMHSIEATGLQQLEATVLSNGKPLQSSEQAISKSERRTAQVAYCLHVMIAYEYGRSIMDISSWPDELVDFPTEGEDFTPELYRLIKCIPPENATSDPISGTQDLVLALKNVTVTHVSHDFAILVRTDIAFSIYRRLRLLVPSLPQDHLDEVIDAGNSALPAAVRLVRQHQSWWNVIGSVFQFVCVLLAVDTTATLAKVPESMETLEIIVETLNTHFATEALNVVRQLIRASLDKKRKIVSILESISEVSTPNGAEYQPVQNDALFDPFLQATLTANFGSLLDMDFMI